MNLTLREESIGEIEESIKELQEIVTIDEESLKEAKLKKEREYKEYKQLPFYIRMFKRRPNTKGDVRFYPYCDGSKEQSNGDIFRQILINKVNDSISTLITMKRAILKTGEVKVTQNEFNLLNKRYKKDYKSLLIKVISED